MTAARQAPLTIAAQARLMTAVAAEAGNPMMFAIINNLPELVLGIAWTGLVFRSGMTFARWRAK